MADKPQITAEEVRLRADLAGIELEPERLEDIAAMLEMALGPLRSLDLRAIRLVEPAGVFSAAWPE
jgi:hypothetical protein